MIAFYSCPEKDKMLAKHKVMLHDMYYVMNGISSMIYECNGYACKLSGRLAEEDKSC